MKDERPKTATEEILVVAKKKTQIPWWVVLLVVLAIPLAPCLILLIGFWTDLTDERSYLSKIQPGMSHAQVIELLPKEMISKPKHKCESLYTGVYLLNSNSLVASELDIHTESPSFGLGEIYFDKEDKVVGIYYSASAGRWKPKWGTPTIVWATNENKNIYPAQQ